MPNGKYFGTFKIHAGIMPKTRARDSFFMFYRKVFIVRFEFERLSDERSMSAEALTSD